MCNQTFCTFAAPNCGILFDYYLVYFSITIYTIAGLSFNDFLDFTTANIMLPLGGLLIVIFLGWRLGKTDFFAEVTNEGALKVPLKSAIFFIIRYLAPLAILVVFISGLFN